MAAGSERGRSEPKRAGAHRPSSEPTLPGGTVEQAKDASLRLLAVRARSRAELAQRLAAKGFTPEVTEAALDRLAEVGLINDAAFAEEWVHARHTFSGKGKQALARELRRKGVAPSDSAPALDAITSDDEESRAVELVRRKLRSMPADLDRDKAIRRLVGMLARRGYNQSTAYQVVKAELAGHGTAADIEDLPDSID
ncbi:recombination regulator RecX [Nocardia sp. NPDC057440]|uniref:recombination regulator RecX n=1 Tax=Nocardia sp. NPDC057440 TaxID=3346134 RepID=UPI00366F76E6